MASNLSSNSTPVHSLHRHCYNFNYAIISIRTLLLLPLSILVLYLGHQRWRQQRSFKTTSHSDIFTYHVAVLDLVWVLGSFLVLCGEHAEILEMIGQCATVFVVYVGPLFHVLTCVERYLAVVHPVTYMGLKNARGAKIRNISIGCVYLLSFACIAITALYISTLPVPIPIFFLLAFCITVVSFCSLSVLRVLIRPGPGDRSGENDRVDQSKQRIFHTVMAILVVLSLWFVGLLASYVLAHSHVLSLDVCCIVLACVSWSNLPSSLLLPLLYLHRAGKLPCTLSK